MSGSGRGAFGGKSFEEPDFKYPYVAGDGREDVKAGKDILRAVRGGAFYDDQRHARCAFRGRSDPGGRLGSVGFRVVIAPGLLLSDFSGLWSSGFTAKTSKGVVPPKGSEETGPEQEHFCRSIGRIVP